MTAGQQAIVDAIRATGATQPIILSGVDFAGDLSQWEGYLPDDPDHQLMADLNTFDCSGNFPAQEPDLAALAGNYPVIIGGFGDTDCSSTFADALMGFVDENGISYLAWTWKTEQDYGPCDGSTPLPTDCGDDPPGYGQGVHDHYLALAAQSSTTTSTGTSTTTSVTGTSTASVGTSSTPTTTTTTTTPTTTTTTTPSTQTATTGELYPPRPGVTLLGGRAVTGAVLRPPRPLTVAGQALLRSRAGSLTVQVVLDA